MSWHARQLLRLRSWNEHHAWRGLDSYLWDCRLREAAAYLIGFGA